MENMTLAKISELPFVREAMQMAAQKNDEELFTKRLELIAKLEDAQDTIKEADVELIPARQKLNEIIEAMHKERGLVGAIEAKKAAATRRYNECSRELMSCGERELADACLLVDCALRGVKQEIDRWEAIRKSPNPDRRGEEIGKANLHLQELRPQLDPLMRAKDALNGMAFARISPAEVIERARSIVETAGLSKSEQ